MGNTILWVLELFGALALFLYGMKMMSESLQKLAGTTAKDILSAMSKNRFMGLLVGLCITAVIQSSSATTVMVVSFVNAGLLSVADSIGVIMGANIGTTITGWIIALFGFGLDFPSWALPALGLAMPLVFSKWSRRHAWGELVLGLALLFIGLGFLQYVVPAVDQSPDFYTTLAEYTDKGYLSVFLFMAVGTLLTVFVQSSSAILTLTMVLCSTGWIPFEMGAAMVVGENLGTTISAVVAARIANVSARRAAMVHCVFNLLGVTWTLILFFPFADIVRGFAGFMTGDSATTIPMALAMCHTFFNLFNALLLICLTKQIERLVMHLKPNKESDDESYHLRFITTGLLSTSELSLVQAKKEVAFFAVHTNKMLSLVRSLIFDTDKGSAFDTTFDKVEQYEHQSDEVELEVANYLTKINQGKLSDMGRRQNKAMLRIVDELESIADSSYKMARIASKMRTQKWAFASEISDRVEMMFSMVEEAMMVMEQNVEKGYGNADLEKAEDCELQINTFREQVRTEHHDNLSRGVYSYEVGVCYTDMILECERLGNCVINISEALSDNLMPRQADEQEFMPR